MERAKALEQLFGDSVVVRVLDFLTLSKDFDYCKAEIAENAGVDATSITRAWPAIERLEIVKQTRTIQRATMYKMNKDSGIAQALVLLSDRIAAYKAKEGLKEKMAVRAKQRTVAR